MDDTKIICSGLQLIKTDDGAVEYENFRSILGLTDKKKIIDTTNYERP
jgi:hypothetical protein